MMHKKIGALLHPERFQGWGKSKRYFEGWYFKIVNESSDLIFAFIPGIAINRKGEGHSFIQIFNGKDQRADYHQFSLDQFSASEDKFDVSVGGNQFASDFIRLDLPDVKGEITFSNMTSWSDKWYAPGIMGPYTFVPFMQCKHGIVSLDHDLEGKLRIGAQQTDFTGGKGYIEKDWGRSFPSAYVWMQTNHFKEQGTSLKLSIARIPWIGSWFVGFIGGLWLDGKLYKFVSYNGTKLERCEINDEEVHVCLANKHYELHVYSRREDSTNLASPLLGEMSEHIKESLTAKVSVKLVSKKEKCIIFEGEGANAGFEVAGNIEDLITK